MVPCRQSKNRASIAGACRRADPGASVDALISDRETYGLGFYSEIFWKFKMIFAAIAAIATAEIMWAAVVILRRRK